MRDVLFSVTQSLSVPVRVAVAVLAILGIALCIYDLLGKPRGRMRTLAIVTLFASSSAVMWFAEFTQMKRSPYGLSNEIADFALVGAFIAMVFLASWVKKSGLVVSGLLAFTFSLLLQFFSFMYWSSGTTKNFSAPLTHLDALYFALGTLGGGTGNLSAVSESARLIQTVQMFLDIAFVLFIVGIVISRYSSARADEK